MFFSKNFFDLIKKKSNYLATARAWLRGGSAQREMCQISRGMPDGVGELQGRAAAEELRRTAVARLPCTSPARKATCRCASGYIRRARPRTSPRRLAGTPGGLPCWSPARRAVCKWLVEMGAAADVTKATEKRRHSHALRLERVPPHVAAW